MPRITTGNIPASARAALVLAAAAIAAWLTLLLSNASSLLNGWDDLRWHVLPQRDSSPVFLIDIDEQSLARHGRWPWPRETLAQLLALLLERHQAAVVGVDIRFPEPSSPGADGALAASVTRRRHRAPPW